MSDIYDADFYMTMFAPPAGVADAFVLDAQLHVWEAPREDRPWIPGGDRIAHGPHPWSPERMLTEMDRTGVDRALLVPPTWEGARNDLVLRAAETWPDRFGAIVRFPINEEAPERIEGWRDDSRVRGARAIFYRESVSWIQDGTADWVWKAAERAGLPVMVYAPGQNAEIARVAARHPDLKIVVCHCGLDIVLRDDEIVPQVESLLPLSEAPNVAVKATSLPSFVTDPYPFPTLTPLLRRILDAFGTDRVMWGSDLTRLSCSYDDLYRYAREELRFLSDDELAGLVGRTAHDWFGWPSGVPAISRSPG